MDSYIAKTLSMAADVCGACEDRARSSAFSQRAAREWKVLIGEDAPLFIRSENMTSNPELFFPLPTCGKWATAVEDIPQGLDKDEFEDWLWCMSKRSQGSTGSGKEESANESKKSKKNKKNKKNKQKKRDKKKNNIQRPEEENIDPVKSQETTKINSADKKQQQVGSGPLANLRSLRSFPTFARLPDENLLNLSFYRNMGVGYVPRRHWCFLGEIVDVGHTVRLVLDVKDASGEVFIFAFHTDGRGSEVDRSKLRIGNTVAVLYANRHDFMFSPPGIRHEEPSSLAVC